MKGVRDVSLVLVTCAFLVCAGGADASPSTFSGVGGTNISGGAVTALNAFDAGIGGVNNGAGAPQSGGFRTITWEGVPEAFADPSSFPAGFYNANSTRGVVLATPGSGVEVSGGSAPSLGFGDLNATYPSDFPAFSPTRVFSPIGSNVTELTFYAAGTATLATVSGFGAIFRNVEVSNTSSIEYFDRSGHSLGKFFAPVGGKSQAEFLGVLFNPETVARVEITTGTTALGPIDNPPGTNVVALDDFAYSEPQALPSPTLTVDSPPDHAVLSESQLTVSGTVTDPAGVVALTVNSGPVAVMADGSWSKQITLSPGSSAIVVVATNSLGNSTQVGRTVTYSPPPPIMSGGTGGQTTGTQAGAAFTVAAALVAVGTETLAPTSFRAAPSGPSALLAKRSYGTRVSYTLNEAASVLFTVREVQPGRKDSAGRCVKLSALNRRARTCTRLVALPGSFTQGGSAGANRFRFTGRLAGRRLKPAKYKLVATPSAGGRAGRAVSASFQITR